MLSRKINSVYTFFLVIPNQIVVDDSLSNLVSFSWFFKSFDLFSYLILNFSAKLMATYRVC